MKEIIGYTIGLAYVFCVFSCFDDPVIVLSITVVVIFLFYTFTSARYYLEKNNKKSANCPCCNAEISLGQKLLFSIESILYAKNYFYCNKCNKLILNLKFYRKKVLIIVSFVYAILLMYFLIYGYFKMLPILFILFILSALYGILMAEYHCYKSKMEADKNDFARVEFKKEKNLYVILLSMLFVFAIYFFSLKLIG